MELVGSQWAKFSRCVFLNRRAKLYRKRGRLEPRQRQMRRERPLFPRNANLFHSLFDLWRQEFQIRRGYGKGWHSAGTAAFLAASDAGAVRASPACGTTSRGDSGTRSERIWPIANQPIPSDRKQAKILRRGVHYGRKFSVRGGGGLSAHVLGVDTCHFSCHPFCCLPSWLDSFWSAPRKEIGRAHV